MRTPEAIGHCDADAFYVSAERVRHRFLVDKPVGVLGNQGACVIARSYEMKDWGVEVGEPVWEARVKCPHGIYVKRDFRWYEVLSRLMLDCIREFSPHVENYSIDESFFVAAPLPGRSLEQTARAIQARIGERVGVPVSVGIARSRTLAKLASKSSKPLGVRAALDGAAMTDLLASRPVTEVPGIAGRRRRRLEPWDIQTCLDFARADRGLIRRLLGAAGEALWWELRGEPVFPIRAERPLHQVLSRGGSLGEATRSPVVLWAWLVRNLERLIEELEFHDLCAGKLTAWVAYRNGRTGVGTTRLDAPGRRFDVLLDAARPCLRRAWVPGVAAERMQLFAEELTRRRHAQLGLFEPSGGRAEAIARLKHAVNERLGRFALRSGATLPLAALYGDAANSYDICDIRGKFCF